jgi:hypothetical protein
LTFLFSCEWIAWWKIGSFNDSRQLKPLIWMVLAALAISMKIIRFNL